LIELQICTSFAVYNYGITVGNTKILSKIKCQNQQTKTMADIRRDKGKYN